MTTVLKNSLNEKRLSTACVKEVRLGTWDFLAIALKADDIIALEEMLERIDTHVHVFPDRIGELLEKVAPAQHNVNRLRTATKQLARPFTKLLHKIQPSARHIPDGIRDGVDFLGGLAFLPHLLVESTYSDLNSEMKRGNVSHSVIIAHPPYSPNEFVLSLAAEDPRLVPIVNIETDENFPQRSLKDWVEKGARGLKIHAPADGLDTDSDHYLSLVACAADLKIPIIIHTGAIQVRPLYKDPDLGHAEFFKAWFGKFPHATFILAHMNYHSPIVAIDLAEEFSNVFLETSWQPSETIGEAYRRLGREKIMIGSDWPIMGGNMKVAFKRGQACINNGLIPEEDAKYLFSLNARKIFGIS